MLPIFVIDNPAEEQEIASMPGVKRMGVNVMIKFLEPLVKMGLKSVLLFAVTSMKKVRVFAISLSFIVSKAFSRRMSTEPSLSGKNIFVRTTMPKPNL